MGEFKVVGLSGSLRAASLNSALLRACGKYIPPGVTFQIHDYTQVPVFSEDVTSHEAVVALRSSISAADAIIIATPEYNGGIPGPLKNAIDWASRPAFRSPFAHKPCAVLSASPSAVGGARAQVHLKSVLGGMSAVVWPRHDFLVGGAPAKFTDGALSDVATENRLSDFVPDFIAWARRLASTAS